MASLLADLEEAPYSVAALHGLGPLVGVVALAVAGDIPPAGRRLNSAEGVLGRPT